MRGSENTQKIFTDQCFRNPILYNLAQEGAGACLVLKPENSVPTVSPVVSVLEDITQWAWRDG